MGTTVIDRMIEPILELVGTKAVFYGIRIAEVARTWYRAVLSAIST